MLILFKLVCMRLASSVCDCDTLSFRDETGTNITCDNRLVNTTGTRNKIRCLPYSKCCVVDSSSFNQRYIAVGYKITFRLNAHSVNNDAGTLILDNNITFTQDALVITAPNIVLEGPCPLLIFDSITKLTLFNISIRCTSGRNVESAILIRNIERLNINMQHITASSKAKSVATVLGGNFDALVPVTSCNITGSSFKNVQLVDSSFRFSVDMVMALFYGTIDIDGIRRLLIQPSVDPALDFPTPLTVPGTRIYNFSEWTNIIGRDYEVILNDPHGTLGYSTIEYDDEQMQIFKVASTVLVGCIILILIRFVGPVSYLYKLAKTP